MLSSFVCDEHQTISQWPVGQSVGVLSENNHVSRLLLTIKLQSTHL